MNTNEPTTPDPTTYIDPEARDATEVEVAGSNQASAAEVAAAQDNANQLSAEELARKAYIRGRNEAISSAMDSVMNRGVAVNLTPGTEPDAPPSDPEMLEIFHLRPSVWP